VFPLREQLLAVSRRRQASQRIVRPDFVVASQPVVSDLARILDRIEQLRRKDLVRWVPLNRSMTALWSVLSGLLRRVCTPIA